MCSPDLTEYHMANPTVFFTRRTGGNRRRSILGQTQPQEAFIASSVSRRGKGRICPDACLYACHQEEHGLLVGGVRWGSLRKIAFVPVLERSAGAGDGSGRVPNRPGSEISAQLSLWERGGSRVLRGNLLVYPIAGSLLYVEPLYIEAEQTKYPQLKKVLVYYKDTVVMEDTLEQALVKLFGEKVGAEGTPKGTGTEQGGPGTPESGAPGKEPGDETAPGDRDEGMVARLTAEEERELRSLFTRLLELENSSKEKLRAADWAGFGQAQQELEQVIRQINDLLS